MGPKLQKPGQCSGQNKFGKCFASLDGRGWIEFTWAQDIVLLMVLFFVAALCPSVALLMDCA